MKKSTSAGLAGVLFWVWMGDAFRSDTAALHIPLVGTRRYNKGNHGHGTPVPTWAWRFAVFDETGTLLFFKAPVLIFAQLHF